jgi:hypothetical protein
MSEASLPMSEDGVRLTDKQVRRRRARSIAIAVTLAVLVLLFYLVTIVRIGGNIAARGLQ